MWQLPVINILSHSADFSADYEQASKEADYICEKLDEMGARCNCEKIDIGPQVIRFSLVAAEGVKIRDIPKLAPELQYDLGCLSIKIQAPLPGEKYVVIEIPNNDRKVIKLGDIISSAQFPLTIPLGVDPSNKIVSADIKEMPHCLVAGTTGSGKSTALNSIICSLLMTTTPDDLLFMMVDTKMVELVQYEDIPNLLCPVILDCWDAVDNFNALVMTMESRYEIVREYGARSIDELNSKLPPGQKLPYILVVVDEMSDLIMASRATMEDAVIRIAQKARAAGIYMILSTQTPRREIVTGRLKSNLPSRLAFSTADALDSRIIGVKDANLLLGNGDCLYSDQGRPPIRLQSPYISSDEVNSIVNHWRHQSTIEQEIVAA